VAEDWENQDIFGIAESRDDFYLTQRRKARQRGLFGFHVGATAAQRIYL